MRYPEGSIVVGLEMCRKMMEKYKQASRCRIRGVVNGMTTSLNTTFSIFLSHREGGRMLPDPSG